MERLTDLDELFLQCRTDIAKSYISEAIACYRAGAYRACIITTWIAAVFDLIEKIKEVALTGHGGAKNLNEAFERYLEQIDEGNKQAIKQLLEFERILLEEARDKLQLLDNHQYLELSRLREDRHRCAHPSFQQNGIPYQPSAELARTHIKNTITYLLSQPPIQGKAALEDLKKRVNSEYFPIEPADAKNALKESPLKKPTEPLVKNFTDWLIFSFFEKEKTAPQRRRLSAALRAILEMENLIAEERLKIHINKIADNIEDDRIKAVVVFCRFFPESWDYLTAVYKQKVVSYIELEAEEKIAPFIGSAFCTEDLKQSTEERIKTFSSSGLATVISVMSKQQLTIPRIVIDKAIEAYTEVKSWNDANYVAENLIMPLINYLTLADIETVIASPETNNSDLVGSSGFNLFVETLLKEGALTKEELYNLLKKHKLLYYFEKRLFAEEDSQIEESIF